jgi:hypothetical protein
VFHLTTTTRKSDFVIWIHTCDPDRKAGKIRKALRKVRAEGPRDLRISRDRNYSCKPNMDLFGVRSLEDSLADEEIEGNVAKLEEYLTNNLGGFGFGTLSTNGELLRTALIHFVDRGATSLASERIPHAKIASALQLEVWFANEYEIPSQVCNELASEFDSLYQQCCVVAHSSRSWSQHLDNAQSSTTTVLVYAKGLQELRKRKHIFDLQCASSSFPMKPATSLDWCCEDQKSMSIGYAGVKAFSESYTIRCTAVDGGVISELL